MNLVSKFRKSDDFEKMGALVSGMRNMVIERSKEVSLHVSDEKWREFIDSLLENAEKESYWTVASAEAGLPPDESVEFTRFPTAVALAALALDQRLFSGKLSVQGIELFKAAADTFPLEGYGEDSLFQICEILLIMGEGSVYSWLQESGQSPSLLSRLDHWKSLFSEKLKQGDTFLPFGGDYKEIYETILAFMKD